MNEEWHLLYTTNQLFEAQCIAAFLEEEGIAAVVHSQADSAHSLMVGQLSLIKVYVEADQYSAAKAVVEDFLSSQNEGDIQSP